MRAHPNTTILILPLKALSSNKATFWKPEVQYKKGRHKLAHNTGHPFLKIMPDSFPLNLDREFFIKLYVVALFFRNS